MENVIIDNRIVNDVTFATRLKHFIREVTVCDPCSEEEKEYLLYVANRLLDYQKSTVTDESEIKYFKNIGVEL